jgi:hypothetical protein
MGCDEYPPETSQSEPSLFPAYPLGAAETASEEAAKDQRKQSSRFIIMKSEPGQGSMASSVIDSAAGASGRITREGRWKRSSSGDKHCEAFMTVTPHRS